MLTFWRCRLRHVLPRVHSVCWRAGRYGVTVLYGLFLASLIRGVSMVWWEKMPLYESWGLGCKFQVCCDEEFHYAGCSGADRELDSAGYRQQAQPHLQQRKSCCADGCGQYALDALDHTLCASTGFCAGARGCECLPKKKQPTFDDAAA